MLQQSVEIRLVTRSTHDIGNLQREIELSRLLAHDETQICASRHGAHRRGEHWKVRERTTTTVTLVVVLTKAVYTATKAACGWAGAVFEVNRPFRQEQ